MHTSCGFLSEKENELSNRTWKIVFLRSQLCLNLTHFKIICYVYTKRWEKIYWNRYPRCFRSFSHSKPTWGEGQRQVFDRRTAAKVWFPPSKVINLENRKNLPKGNENGRNKLNRTLPWLRRFISFLHILINRTPTFFCLILFLFPSFCPRMAVQKRNKIVRPTVFQVLLSWGLFPPT